VIISDGQATEGDAGTVPATAPADPVPWYEGLLDSVRAADG
jgi:hypothetical protein